MIEEITVYRTSDGKTFLKHSEAESHEREFEHQHISVHMSNCRCVAIPLKIDKVTFEFSKSGEMLNAFTCEVPSTFTNEEIVVKLIRKFNSDFDTDEITTVFRNGERVAIICKHIYVDELKCVTASNLKIPFYFSENLSNSYIVRWLFKNFKIESGVVVVRDLNGKRLGYYSESRYAAE